MSFRLLKLYIHPITHVHTHSYVNAYTHTVRQTDRQTVSHRTYYGRRKRKKKGLTKSLTKTFLPSLPSHGRTSGSCTLTHIVPYRICFYYHRYCYYSDTTPTNSTPKCLIHYYQTCSRSVTIYKNRNRVLWYMQARRR